MSSATPLSHSHENAPRQRSQAARAGVLRDALKTQGLENNSSKEEPGVPTMPAPAQLTGRVDVPPGRTQKSHGKNCPLEMPAAVCQPAEGGSKTTDIERNGSKPSRSSSMWTMPCHLGLVLSRGIKAEKGSEEAALKEKLVWKPSKEGHCAVSTGRSLSDHLAEPRACISLGTQHCCNGRGSSQFS